MEWRYPGHKDGNGRLQDGGEDREVSEGGVECWGWGCQRQPPTLRAPPPIPSSSLCTGSERWIKARVLQPGPLGSSLRSLTLEPCH